MRQENQLNGVAICAGVGGLELGLRLVFGSRYRAMNDKPSIREELAATSSPRPAEEDCVHCGLEVRQSGSYGLIHASTGHKTCRKLHGPKTVATRPLRVEQPQKVMQCDIYGTEGNKGCRVHKYVTCPTLDAEGIALLQQREAIRRAAERIVNAIWNADRKEWAAIIESELTKEMKHP